MKILLTNTGPWGTGSFTVAEAVMQELQALGHEVKLFFPDTGLPSTNHDNYYSRPDQFVIWKFPLKTEGVTFKEFPLIIPDPHPRVKKEKTFRDLTKHELGVYFSEAKKELTHVFNEFKPDIVECQHIWAMDRIVCEAGYPFICTAHHSDQLGFEYDPRMQPIALEAAKEAKFIFAISDYVKNEVIRIYNVPPEKVVILTNGYDKNTFYPKEVDREAFLKKMHLKIPKNARLISFAGKISKTKGIDILLKANKLLSKNKNIHFLVFGSGNIERVLNSSDRTEYCMNHIHLLGHHPTETLAEAHNICDFSMLPSRTEGFGISALEAMGCGLPIIATDSGGIKEFAVGRVIPPKNPQKLAEAIEDLLSLSKVSYHLLCEEALQRAETYSWSFITHRRVEFYKRALSL